MHFYIDRPEPNAALPRLVHFAGWLQSDRDTSNYSFFINDTRQDNVQFHDRGDVPDREGLHTFGWNFVCEVGEFATADQGAVTLSVLEQGICVARSYYTCVPANPQPCLFIMHIPKTAGTSIRAAMEGLYKPSEFFCLYDDPCYIAMRQVQNLSSRAFDDTKIVYGHFSFGVHRHTSRAYRYISFLRRPHDYLQSYFFFMKYVVKNAIFVTKNIFEGMAEIDIIEFDNCYTRYFSGKLDNSAVDISDFDTAIENIKRDFAFVGCMDFLQSSLDELSRYLGRDIRIGRLNETPDVPERRYLDIKRFRKEAARHIVFDLMLYDFVLAHFWGGGECAQLCDEQN